ncbi:hypothetical protein AL523_09180 [Enterococcus gallinarum]|nr:hypothetical protein AL523_09180 [Enterococcus gallinarum]EPH59252.1 hypothetical protein D931_03823 [Enterococcus faecium 13.SD.W.09]
MQKNEKKWDTFIKLIYKSQKKNKERQIIVHCSLISINTYTKNFLERKTASKSLLFFHSRSLHLQDILSNQLSCNKT